MRFLNLTLLGLLLVGCGHDYTDIASSASRDTSPSTADVQTLTTNEASFAFDLYRAQVGADARSNVFFSPYSISVALAMTYAGTQGNTASQIASAMHFTLPPAQLHTAFDALDLALASRQERSPLDRQLDLGSALARVRQAVPRHARGRLRVGGARRRFHRRGRAGDERDQRVGRRSDRGQDPEPLPAGLARADTRVVLVNAIYFDANWKTQFDSSKTTPAPFTKLDGTTVNAPLMNLSKVNAPVALAPTYAAIDIPYAGGQTSMLVIMPNGGQFASVEASLGGDFLAQVVASLQAQDVALSLPKFTLNGASVSLRPALESLGMVDAFDPAKADLTPMATSDQPLHVDDVVHQAYVRVDESGTEAAAATGVSTGVNAIVEVQPLVVNRPFFFVLRDVPTGAVLFVGRVMDPTLVTP